MSYDVYDRLAIKFIDGGNFDKGINTPAYMIFANVSENSVYEIAEAYNTVASSVFATDPQSLALFKLMIAYKTQASLEIALDAKLGLVKGNIPKKNQSIVELANSKEPLKVIEGAATFSGEVAPYKEMIVKSGKEIKKAKDAVNTNPSYLFAPVATWAQWKKAFSYICNNITTNSQNKKGTPHPFIGFSAVLDAVLPNTLGELKGFLELKKIIKNILNDEDTLAKVELALEGEKISNDASAYRYGRQAKQHTWQEVCSILEAINSDFSELTDYKEAQVRSTTTYALLSKMAGNKDIDKFNDLEHSKEGSSDDNHQTASTEDKSLADSKKTMSWISILSYHILGHYGIDLKHTGSYTKQQKKVPFSLIPLELHPLNDVVIAALNKAASKVVKNLLNGQSQTDSGNGSPAISKNTPFDSFEKLRVLGTYGTKATKRLNTIQARAEFVACLDAEATKLIGLINDLGSKVDSLTSYISDAFKKRKLVYKDRYLALNPEVPLINNTDIKAYENNGIVTYSSSHIIGWCEDIVSYGLGYGDAAFARSLPHMSAVTESFSIKDLGDLYGKVVMHYALHQSTFNLKVNAEAMITRIIKDFEKGKFLFQDSQVNDLVSVDAVYGSTNTEYDSRFFLFKKKTMDYQEKLAVNGSLKFQQKNVVYGVGTDTIEIGLHKPKEESSSNVGITHNAMAVFYAYEFILDNYAPRTINFVPNGVPHANLAEEVESYHSRLATMDKYFSKDELEQSDLIHAIFHSALTFGSEGSPKLGSMLEDLSKKDCYIRTDVKEMLEQIANKHCRQMFNFHKAELLSLFIRVINNTVTINDRVEIGNAMVQNALRGVVDSFIEPINSISSDMLAVAYLIKLATIVEQELKSVETSTTTV